MTRWLFALSLGMLLAGPACAQIYSYVDANGQTVFTDRPPAAAGNTEVELQPTNRMPAAQRLVRLKPPEEVTRQLAPPPPAYQQLQLLRPQADETLRNTGRTIEIEVASTPELLPGHGYQLWLDGKPYGKPVRNAVWQADEVDRGSHQLQVRIVDAQGNQLLESGRITVHMHQTSLAQKRHVRPCQDDDYGVRPECPLADKPEKEKRSWLIPWRW